MDSDGHSFAVDHGQNNKKKLGRGKMLRSKSVEPLQVSANDSHSALNSPLKSTPELTDEEREKYKILPRPKSAAVATSEVHSRPTLRTNPIRSGSLERPATGEARHRPESSSERTGQNAVGMRLKPKYLSQSLSEKSSQHSQLKTLGCPECFHAFGGLCVTHLQTSWKGSMKQVSMIHGCSFINAHAYIHTRAHSIVSSCKIVVSVIMIGIIQSCRPDSTD